MDNVITDGSYESATCGLNLYSFSERLMDTNVNFQVFKMQGSFYLWVGTKPETMSNLAVAMKTQFDPEPSSCKVLGKFTDSTSTTLAQKLAKKTGKQVFVSYNIATEDTMMLPLVEKRIMTEMINCEDKF
nr:proteasome assembly chaperone 4 [Arenicola marina]